MNRNQALEQLLQGNRVVSYFGFEYELTKHGIQVLAPAGEQDCFLPMSTSCNYSFLGAVENPYEQGTIDWARFEYEAGREVTSPSGLGYSLGDWEDHLFKYQDLMQKGWTVEGTKREESEQLVPPPSEQERYDF